MLWCVKCNILDSAKGEIKKGETGKTKHTLKDLEKWTWELKKEFLVGEKEGGGWTGGGNHPRNCCSHHETLPNEDGLR